ncbi:MAG: ABC transporter permease [Deltaproteobacteria bacterium]|nr:ABC transporter permease [Deltaproteobacteria bacterium]
MVKTSSFHASLHRIQDSLKQPLGRMGTRILEYLDYVGGIAELAYRAVKAIARGQIQIRLVLEQVLHIGVKSLSLVNLVAIFTGMVLALQFIVGLQRFGLTLYAGQVVGIAIVRELGPVLTSLMIAARVGSGIAAELGSMAVTEQVLAIEAMGANPVAKLVVPRVLVTTLITPILTVIADVVGIFGGMFVAVLESGVTARFYIDQVLRTVELEDFFSGTGKTFFFGFLIGIIACNQGLRTTRGTQGVGESTTLSVVIASVAIFVSDYFLTKLFLLF